eukprot:g13295.t1
MAVRNRDKWLVNLHKPRERCPVLEAAFGSNCSARLRAASSAELDEKYEELILGVLLVGLSNFQHLGDGGAAAATITKRGIYRGWHGPELVTLGSYFAAAAERDDVGRRRMAQMLLQLRHAANCRETNGTCKVAGCEARQSLWAHLQSCTLPTCDYPECAFASRQLLHLSECSKERCGVCQPVKKFIEDARTSCIAQSREEKKSEEMSEACVDSLAERLADTVVAARRLDRFSTLMVGCDQRDEARKLVETIQSLSPETHQPVGAYQRPPADASTTRGGTMQMALAEQVECSSRTRRRTANITPRSSKRIRVDASPVNSFVGIDAAEETATCSPGDDGEIEESVFAAEDDTSECSFGQNFNDKGDEIIDEQRSLLIVLHHIYTCSKEEGECWATNCDDLKRIWGHARACDRQDCDEAGGLCQAMTNTVKACLKCVEATCSTCELVGYLTQRDRMQT